MARKAVAATLASVVLLSVLVLADATVVTAQDNVAAAAQTQRLQSRELLEESSLSGEVSMQVLARVQAYLSSNVAECGAIQQYLASIRASSSVSGNDSGVEYHATANSTAAAVQVARQDNLTVLASFAGYSPGQLGLVENLSVEETGGGGVVSLHRHEVHALNLPVQPGSAASLCSSTLSSLAAALSRAPCNATLEQAAFEGALPALVGEAGALGFELTAGWSPAGCSAAYWVTLVEPGVAGAAGSFDWTVHGSGVA